MIGRLNIFFTLLKRTSVSWYNNDPFGKSAIIAYYTLFSLPSLLMIVVSITGYFFGVEAVKGRIVQKLGGLIGEGVSEAIEGMIANASLNQSSTFSIILGVAMLFFGATGVFVQFKKSMNAIWRVKSKKDGFLKTLLDRLISFGMILVLGFLFLVSLILSILLNVTSEYVGQIAPVITAVIADIFSFLLSFCIITGLFGAIFKWLPDIDIRWKTTFLGAGLTTLLFLIGEYLLGFYFTKSDPTSVYGGSSSVVLILLWVYYTCIIIFFGVEFTFQYAAYRNEKVGPNKKATSEAL
ncbi:YihY/virulence factor BrkB family protein [Flavobacteriaceae bacterium KMM 6897]|nr:YihY/virulence factor BrkB family protein [Flavobacteriaceae bacterium KMM 6897]MEB8345529.1 YihY/virulence factor BrkB family protein [Flavobacteriaceae bacterium KMM 6898]